MSIDHNEIVESKRAVRITTNIFWNYWQVMYSFHLKSFNYFPVIPSVNSERYRVLLFIL